ncbi:MAG: hypothetical protein RMI56_04415 [Sulfolobales archaeon]|nr:hypothetical protein [Sulfolobales archaeon]MDW8083027.1 hypothetical protein [Sulfolobales archaeon]
MRLYIVLSPILLGIGLVRWVCDCPICRTLVHPILSRISTPESATRVSSNSVEEAVSTDLGVEVATSETKEATQPAEAGSTPATPAPEVGVKQQTVKVEIPEEVLARISQLEEEIKRVRDEINVVSEGLKSAVLEFKEAIAEISSPFNALRNSESGNGNHRNGKAKMNGSLKIAPSTFVNMLRVIDSMLNEIDKETVRTLLSSYTKAGLISESVSSSLLEIVELVYILKNKGISIEKQLPYLYALTQALNIEDQSLAAVVLKEMIKRGNLG